MIPTTVDNEFREQLRAEVLRLQAQQQANDAVEEMQQAATVVGLYGFKPSIAFVDGEWRLCFNPADTQRMCQALAQHILKMFGDTNEKE